MNFIDTNQEGILYKEYEISWFDFVVPLSGESGEGIVEAYLDFSLVPVIMCWLSATWCSVGQLI